MLEHCFEDLWVELLKQRAARQVRLCLLAIGPYARLSKRHANEWMEAFDNVDRKSEAHRVQQARSVGKHGRIVDYETWGRDGTSGAGRSVDGKDGERDVSRR